jgi:putative ABC transport system substrate-binding protein
MRRRELLITLGVAALARAAPLRAQRNAGFDFRIGYLAVQPLSKNPNGGFFIDELRKLGYIENQNTLLDVRSAEGEAPRLTALATQLVATHPNVIIALSTPSVLALKATGSSVPVVFVAVSDPVGIGVVDSVAHPGSNFTGVSNSTGELAPKRLQLLKELIPGLRRVAMLRNATNPASVNLVGETVQQSPALGVRVIVVDYQRGDELPEAIERAVVQGAQAMLSSGDVIIQQSYRQAFIELLNEKKLPALLTTREQVIEGGLASYGSDYREQWRLAAFYVDKILHGAKPAELPVIEPTKFELVINLKTAKALGLTVPQSLLARADEVIE